MDDHFDIGRVFEIGKFDITRLTCIKNESHVVVFCCCNFLAVQVQAFKK